MWGGREEDSELVGWSNRGKLLDDWESPTSTEFSLKDRGVSTSCQMWRASIKGKRSS
jgi:hypothetical protein